MGNLIAEILLRFLKPLVALVLGAALYGLISGPLGEPGTWVLALLCWLAACTFLLLVQEGPL